MAGSALVALAPMHNASARAQEALAEPAWPVTAWVSAADGDGGRFRERGPAGGPRLRVRARRACGPAARVARERRVARPAPACSGGGPARGHAARARVRAGGALHAAADAR